MSTAPERSARPRTPKGRARVVVSRLGESYPGDARSLCALRHDNPFELLVATILSAQCTDERVNLVMPAVMRRWPDPAAMAAAERSELEDVIRPTGFFRNKTTSLLGMSAAVDERFGGRVPARMEDLVSLPGVGRKTANVVLSVAFDVPGLPVDTHVGRLARRLGLTAATEPEKVERDLCAIVPKKEWGALSLRLILHGRRVCLARRPACARCVLADICPSSTLPTRAARPRRSEVRRPAAVADAG